MKLEFGNQISRVKPLYDYLRTQRENKKFLRSVEVSATFALVTFFLFFAVRPTFLTISKLKGDIESKKIIKKELKDKINNTIQAQILFSQIQERYFVVDSSLPGNPKYSQAASQIIKTGQSLGTPIDKLVFGFDPDNISKTDPNLKMFSVTLNMDGGYRNSLQIASELLKNRRIINIDSLSFSLNTEKNIATSSSSNKLLSTFTSKFYYWPEKNEKK